MTRPTDSTCPGYVSNTELGRWVLAGSKPGKDDVPDTYDPLDTLGHTVRDAVSGAQGVVTAVTQDFTGNWRLGVQPPSVEGRVQDTSHFDDSNFDYVEAERLPPAPRQLTPFRHGDVVRDVFTEIVGAVSATTWFLNGCVYHTVLTDRLGPGGQTLELWASSQRLEPWHRDRSVSGQLLRERVVNVLDGRAVSPTGGPVTRGRP